MSDKISYICPKCDETLTCDDWCVNLLDKVSITCPSCNTLIKGSELKKPEPKSYKKDATAQTSSDKNTPHKVNATVTQAAPIFEVAGFTIADNYIDEVGTPGGKGDFYKISTAKTVVGRQSNSSKADIQIPSNRYMSRQHAVITKEKEGYRIKWAGATNPLIVNDILVDSEKGVMLKNGDKITMGHCVAIWKYELIDSDKSISLL